MILRCVVKKELKQRTLKRKQQERPAELNPNLNVRSRTTNGEGIIQDTFPISIYNRAINKNLLHILIKDLFKII